MRIGRGRTLSGLIYQAISYTRFPWDTGIGCRAVQAQFGTGGISAVEKWRDEHDP